jgi:hypothetical protein
MLNYNTIQLSALVKVAEYQNRKNTDVSVPNTVSVLRTNANTQSAACKLYCTIQYKCQSQ